jgi:thiosulfate/3-mercaptopyruvate sulfurtransferase
VIRSLGHFICLALFSCSAWASGELRIDPQTLNGLLQRADVVVLDARPVGDYRQGHLPGARSFPYLNTFENRTDNGRIPPLPQAQALFGAAGLRKTDLVIVYDGGRMLHAARLLWMLEVYGHERVKLLDGGLSAWQQAGMDLSQVAATYEATQYVPTVNPRRLATRFTTLLATRKPQSYVILDARERSHYVGLESEALRFGHIPQARNIAVSKNLTADGLHLKPKTELAMLYQDLPKDRKIITYCSIGLVSSLQYLVLRELGYDVANYDASWKEWGNDSTLPIVSPEQSRAKPR